MKTTTGGRDIWQAHLGLAGVEHIYELRTCTLQTRRAEMETDPTRHSPGSQSPVRTSPPLARAIDSGRGSCNGETY